MTKRKNTKRALLTSVLSMLLCCAMLIGSTFAWFTDSVNSGKNRIVAGNLDAQLFYKTGDMTDWRDVESLKPEDTNPFFRGAGGDIILWEPGAIGVTSFKVENVGTLAFKYALALLAVKYNQLDGRDLRDVIKFAVIDGEPPEDFTAQDAQGLNYSAFPDFTKRSALRPKDGDNAGEYQEIFTVVAYWKPNSDSIDNLYNVSNGKTATELDGTPSAKTENRLYLDIDIRLNAWQDTVESDSFDDQYDAMADALDTFPDGCYSVTEHESWVELDIYTGRSTADIHISYPGYAPDNTDERMRDWKTNASGTITPAAANGNTHLIFFKTADKGSFTLTQDDYVLPMLPVKEDGTIVQSIADQSGAVYSERNAVAPTADTNAVSAPAVSVDLNDVVFVSSEEEMLAVVAELNQNGGKTTVKLVNNIELTQDWWLNKGTLTILGEGHSITFTGGGISFNVTDTATLNLGADDYNGSLTVCTSIGTGAPLISVCADAKMNICEDVVIDGLEKAMGGGVSTNGKAIVNLLGGTIQNCIHHAQTGGGIVMIEYSTFNMYSGEIKNCSSEYGAGALGIAGSPISYPAKFSSVFNMYGGTISGCSGFYGTICLSGTSEFNMYDGTIEDCQGYLGGAVFLDNSSEFNMFDGTIENCESAVGGGVFMFGSSVFNMSDGTIKGCVSTGELAEDDYGSIVCAVGGAAVCMFGPTVEVTMNGGLITGCHVEAKDTEANNSFNGLDVYGGAIFVGSGTLNLNNGAITGNTVARGEAKSAYGGGIGSPYLSANTEINISDSFKLYGNTAETAGDDIARESTAIKLSLGNVNTDAQLSDGPVDGWYSDESDNRWGSENYPYDEAKIAAGETTAQFIKAAHGVTTAMKGVGAPGRLLDLYTGEDSIALISKGGAKTVKWDLKSSDLAECVNASAPIVAGTKITMAYKGDSTIVHYSYLIVEEDTTSVSLSDFTAMGRNERFASEEGIKNPIYQFSFVFPETQENMSVWMSKEVDNVPNGSAVNIDFSEKSVPTPSGTLEANRTTVTVSGLAGFEADQSDSRHNTLQALADRKAVLAVEAVDAQGRNVAMSSDTVVTVGGSQAKVSAGIAAAEIAEDGTYPIEVSALPQDAVGIRVSLCYTDNSIIHKPLANVLASTTVKP